MIRNLYTGEDFTRLEQNGLYLSKYEIGVFRVHLQQIAQWIGQKMHLLNCEEQARRQSFVYDKDRLRFAVGRICAKELAAYCLRIKPEQILIVQGKHQKPVLLNGGGALQYNLSHSGDRVLFAFAFDADVGIDVEQVRYLQDYKTLCDCLHGFEKRRVLESGDFKTFYQYWTAKEAYIKADGRGFGIDFASFYISKEDRLFEANGKELKAYQLVRISETEKYAEALVYRERAGKLIWREDTKKI